MVHVSAWRSEKRYFALTRAITKKPNKPDESFTVHYKYSRLKLIEQSSRSHSISSRSFAFVSLKRQQQNREACKRFGSITDVKKKKKKGIGFKWRLGAELPYRKKIREGKEENHNKAFFHQDKQPLAIVRANSITTQAVSTKKFQIDENQRLVYD